MGGKYSCFGGMIQVLKVLVEGNGLVTSPGRERIYDMFYPGFISKNYICME